MAIDKRPNVLAAAPTAAGVPMPKRARPHDVAAAIGGEGDEVTSGIATIKKEKISSPPAPPPPASRTAGVGRGGGGGGGGHQRPPLQPALPSSQAPNLPAASAMGGDRRWMYEGWRKDGAHSNEWAAITKAFLKCAFSSATSAVLKCPCSECYNYKYQDKLEVERHLCKFGFMPNYEIWYEHGESRHAEVGGGKRHERFSMNAVEDDDVELSQGKSLQGLAGGGQTTEQQEVTRLRHKLAQSEADRLLQDRRQAFLEGQLKAQQDLLKSQQDYWVSLWRQQQEAMHAYLSWYRVPPMPFTYFGPPPMMTHTLPPQPAPPPPPGPQGSTSKPPGPRTSPQVGKGGSANK